MRWCWRGAVVVLLLGAWASAAERAWDRIATAFAPPAELAGDMGKYRSPLLFDDGRPVKTPQEWRQRREEILNYWWSMIGEWPATIPAPKVEVVETTRRENFAQRKIRLEAAPGLTLDAYVLVPDGRGQRPAVLVVFYDPETGVGLNDKKNRDFGLQLARRGFVALSIGWPTQFTESESPRRQSLSTLAYIAANGYNALANMPEVDPKRVGVVGHSFGGKWAMFAACLNENFAATAWSDPGIVFDESRPNVNYWEPWYLGWEAGTQRKRGVPTGQNPRTGPYKRMIETGHDLHELHALMAPRPFLVSGGAEDQPERWRALNHAVAVNRLLGYENRVAMTNRPAHDPTEESNEKLCLFFEHFLKESPVEPRPLARAHSHNDYAHRRPLEDALAQGFCSVEADIFLRDGQLLVAHTDKELKPERTLQALYLDPLRKRVKANGGRVHRNGPVLNLLIDLKTEAEPTYAALRDVLAGYGEMVTSIEDGVVHERAVRVIVSGNRPEAMIAADKVRHVGIDGRLTDLDSDKPVHLMPLISDNWRTQFAWKGEGAMPADQREKLRSIVKRAHAKGRMVRFWAAPDRPEAWRELLNAGADLLSVDDLAGLSRYLLVNGAAQTGAR